MPASAITRPEPTTVTIEASCWVRSAVLVRCANSRSSSVAHRVGDVVHALRGVAGAGLAHHATPPAASLRLAKSMVLREFVEPGLERRAAAA